jgi:hypothetical protein
MYSITENEESHQVVDHYYSVHQVAPKKLILYLFPWRRRYRHETNNVPKVANLSLAASVADRPGGLLVLNLYDKDRVSISCSGERKNLERN